MLVYVDGVMVEETEVEAVVSKGKGYVVGASPHRAEELLSQSTRATDVALMALNEILGQVPRKEVIEVTSELLSSLKANINKEALKYHASGKGQRNTTTEEEVDRDRQVKRIVGYDKNGIAILQNKRR